VIRRVAGIIISPRATLAGLVHRPVWVVTWLVILLVFTACGTWLLTTDVGQQALVDERVRVIETFGGRVDAAQYAALLARPPWWVYLSSGGRLLLTPAATLLAAGGIFVLARRDAQAVTFTQALAITVHASIVLALGQVIATPVHYIRESLTAPLNLAAVLPLMEEGTLAAKFFGSVDLFVMWWVALLAAGLSALTHQRVSRYARPLAAIYLAFAAVMTGIIALTGGL
jgi:hypothetical protein